MLIRLTYTGLHYPVDPVFPRYFQVKQLLPHLYGPVSSFSMTPVICFEITLFHICCAWFKRYEVQSSKNRADCGTGKTIEKYSKAHNDAAPEDLPAVKEKIQKIWPALLEILNVSAPWINIFFLECQGVVIDTVFCLLNFASFTLTLVLSKNYRYETTESYSYAKCPTKGGRT